VKRKQRRSIEEKDEDDKDLQMLNNGALKKKKLIQQKKSSKKTIKVEYEGKKDRKNWVDGNVETLIALYWKMEPNFLKNGKKKG